MQCLISPFTDIYSNLALEEYLLLKKSGDFFIVWQAGASIVVGKHQNALAEINLRFADRHAMKIARRLSGGGTVFHDAGNLNFTFINEGEPGKLVDFARYVQPVIAFLATLKVEAVRGKKNEILADGKKISGNAEHVYKNRVMHHGTLLFHADLSLLHGGLEVLPGRYIDKAVQSNRGEVTNLSALLPQMDIHTFREAFFMFIQKTRGGLSYSLNEQDYFEIRRIADEKYSTWEWIFGWSPDYEINTILHAGNHEIDVNLHVHRGIITSCKAAENSYGNGLDMSLEQLLPGRRHERSAMKDVLDQLLPGLDTSLMVYDLF